MIVLVGLCSLHGQSNLPYLDYSTFVGSNSGALYIGADRSGSAYVAGIISRPVCDARLPGIETPFSNGFITKLSAGGDASLWTLCLPSSPVGISVLESGTIIFATFDGQSSSIFRVDSGPQPLTVPIGSLQAAWIRSLVVDPQGSIYLAGDALQGFKATEHAYRAVPRDNCDPAHGCRSGFIAKLDPAGRVIWSTFTGTAEVSALATDSRGAPWIAGFGGIAKFDPEGANRTFFEELQNPGSAPPGDGISIVADVNDAVYVTGYTLSDPKRYGSYFQYTSSYCWVRKLATDGSNLWTNSEAFKNLPHQAMPIVVDQKAGRVYVGLSAVVTALKVETGSLLVRRHAPMPVASIVADPQGRIYICGGGNYGAFVATPGAWITQYPGGSWSGYAARLDPSHAATFEVTRLVNAATYTTGRDDASISYIDGSIAPGELVTLFGDGFRPDRDLQVTVAGRTAPIVFANAQQINAVVPFGVAPATLATVSVRSSGQTIDVFELPVRDMSPGVFAPVLNADWSENTQANPVSRGSVVTLFMTGLGPYDLWIEDGSLGPLSPIPAVRQRLTALVGGQEEGEVLFAGQAPGMIAGIVQVNLRIPASLPKPGAYVIAVRVDQRTLGPWRYPNNALSVNVR